MSKKKKERVRTRDELVKAFDYHKAQAEKCHPNSIGVYEHHSKRMSELLNALNELDAENETA